MALWLIVSYKILIVTHQSIVFVHEGLAPFLHSSRERERGFWAAMFSKFLNPELASTINGLIRSFSN